MKEKIIEIRKKWNDLLIENNEAISYSYSAQTDIFHPLRSRAEQLKEFVYDIDRILSLQEGEKKECATCFFRVVKPDCHSCATCTNFSNWNTIAHDAPQPKQSEVKGTGSIEDSIMTYLIDNRIIRTETQRELIPLIKGYVEYAKQSEVKENQQTNTSPQMITIKILQCSDEGYGYKDRIGQTYEVEEPDDYCSFHDLLDGSGLCILKKDCEIIKQSESRQVDWKTIAKKISTKFRNQWNKNNYRFSDGKTIEIWIKQTIEDELSNLKTK